MNGMEHLKRPLRAVSAIAVIAMLAMALGTSGSPGRAGAQEGSPEALPRSREQVIAQGLAIFDIEPAIWRVVEIEPAPFDDAEEVTGDVSFTLQREGTTIIRNNVTLKRARIEPGEAYFFSAEDPYLQYSLRGSPSVAWSIEYVAADADDEDAGGDVIYKTDPIEAFQPGTRDLELVRNLMLPGDVAALPSHRGPALLLGTGGAITVSARDASMEIGEGNGILLPGDAVISNTSDTNASYVVVVTGARVPDPGVEPADEEEAQATKAPVDEEEDGTPEAETEAEATEAPTATATPESTDSDGDGLSDERETELQTDPEDPDSDGDGTSDGDEVFLYGTDPNDVESTP